MGGKKGKMTNYGSSHEKWKGTEYLRELPAAISMARKGSRDESAILSKKLADELLQRRSRNYFHLSSLVKDRLSDDIREDAGDRRWISSLTSGSAKVLKENKDKAYNIGKIRAASAIINASAQLINTDTVPSLRNICLETIACNLFLYETETLQKLFCSLPPQISQLLSFLCAQYQTIDDDNLECLTNIHIQYLILGENISDAGITKFVSSTIKSNISENEERESWWETSLESYEICPSHSLLTQLTLLGCSVSFMGLLLMRDQFKKLEFLVIHSANFRYGFESSHDTFCVVFCRIFSGWPCLRELHLSYCPWVTVDALETLIGSFRNVQGKTPTKCDDFRKLNSDEDFLPNPVYVSKIVVTGIYETENVTSKRIDDLAKNFKKFCNIEISLTI